MASMDIDNLQPGASYLVQVIPVSDDGTEQVGSFVHSFVTPSANYDGSRLTAQNTVVHQYVDENGAIISGSDGGPDNPVNTMYIDGTGLHAYDSNGASTVYISSNNGTAYFSGSVTVGNSSSTVALVPNPVVGGIAIFAGNATASSAPFYVTNTGSLVATSASINGNITASTGTIGGFTIGASALTATNIVISSTDGFSLGSSSAFRVNNSGSLVASSATIIGSITATSGSIGGFTINSGSLIATGASISGTSGIYLGSPTKFSVDTSGNMTATSASLTGQITAQSGSITGDLTISSAGRLIAGTLGTNATVVSGSGITGTQSGIPTFTLPTDGSAPTIGGFKIVQTGLTSVGQTTIYPVNGASGAYTLTMSASSASTLWIGMSASGTSIGSGALITGISSSVVTLSASNTAAITNASITFIPNSNMVVGTTTSDNITIRGQNAPGLLPAIFTTIGGTATTASTGAGFYIGQDGKLNIGSKLLWDGSTLTVNGSGSFTGNISASTGSIAGFTLANNILWEGTSGSIVGISNSSVAFFAGATASTGAGAKFTVLEDGSLTATSASITGYINATSGSFSGTLNAAGGTFTGTLSANSITSGTIDSARIDAANLTVGSLQTYPSTTNSRIRINNASDQRHKIFFESGWANEATPATIQANYYQQTGVGYGGSNIGLTIQAGTTTAGATGSGPSISLQSWWYHATYKRRIISIGDQIDFMAYDYSNASSEISLSSRNVSISTNNYQIYMNDSSSQFFLSGDVTMNGNVFDGRSPGTLKYSPVQISTSSPSSASSYQDNTLWVVY